MNILAHGGLQLCGGRDFDRTLVDNIVRPWLVENFDLSDDFSGNPAFKPLLRLATWATERAKIELSSKDESVISLSETEIRTNDLNHDEVYLDIPLDRNSYEKLIDDQITETIVEARKTLSKTGYTPNDIQCIVWVGGPTHYKPLRDKVAFELGIRGDRLDVNPMTAVAEGAGIWAESVDWNSNKVNEESKPESVNNDVISSDEPKFDFRYNERTPDDTTKIALQVEGLAPTGYEFQVNSLDSGWTSGRVSLQHGTTINVNLTEQGENQFSCIIYDELGNTIKQEEIVISKVDISMDKIPAELSIALEVVREFGGKTELEYLVEEGELLPKEGNTTVYAAESLEAGSSNSLNFKLKEFDSSGREKPMAILKINGTDFAEGSIPVNAPLNCSYKKTLGGNVEFEVEVDIGGNNRTFDDVLFLDVDATPSPVQIFEKARHTLTRVDTIQKLAGDDPKLEEQERRLKLQLPLKKMNLTMKKSCKHMMLICLHRNFSMKLKRIQKIEKKFGKLT